MTGIERLRELIDENGPGRYIVVPAVGGTYQGGYIAATMDICNKLADIADQIERETDKVARADWQAVRDVAYDMADRVFMSATIDELLREWSRKLNDATDGHVHPAADVSMSAYDLLPQEDRDAIAWVREHGGLDAVKRRWECLSYYADPVPRSYAERRIAARQRQIDESHAALRRRNELIAELNARVENQRAALDGLVKSIDEMRPRLMPEGMDWPRFEDGEPVRIGDVAADKDGDGFDVWSIEFDGEMVNLAGEHRRELFLMPGVRVKRPTPKVLDADGAEIELGDDLYIVEGSLKLHVSHVDRINGMIATDAMFSLDKWADPAMYTHRAPVLAADGRPLREGETVWDNDGVELDVVATRPLGNRPDLNRVNVRAKGGFKVHTVDADSLTHERPDSWERLEEDATIRPEAYCVKRGIDFSDVDGQHRVLDEVTERMARDLVRRAKALAGGA